MKDSCYDDGLFSFGAWDLFGIWILEFGISKLASSAPGPTTAPGCKAVAVGVYVIAKRRPAEFQYRHANAPFLTSLADFVGARCGIFHFVRGIQPTHRRREGRRLEAAFRWQLHPRLAQFQKGDVSRQ